MTISPEDVLKLLLAVLVGGLVGVEREFHNKAAGFRTLIFICVGATLFTIFSVKIAVTSDPARIAAQIVTGVGFIGAGVIMQDSGRIYGLTTAATIWLVASLGIGLGIGQYVFVGAASLAALIVLWLFPLVERGIDRLRDDHVYEIVGPASPEHYQRLAQTLQDSGLRATSMKQTRSRDELTHIWHLSGPPSLHQQLAEKLIADPDIKEFRF